MTTTGKTKRIYRIMQWIIIASVVSMLILYFSNSIRIEKIPDLNFIKNEVPVSLGGNFDVDSSGNLYFSTWTYGTISIYDATGKYLYSLNAVKEIGGTSGSYRVKLTKDDVIEVFFVRERKVVRYDTWGNFISIIDGEEYYDQNKPTDYYMVEKEIYTYQTVPSNNFFFSIVRNDIKGNRTTVFMIPAWQIGFVLAGIAIIVSIFLIAFTYYTNEQNIGQ